MRNFAALAAFAAVASAQTNEEKPAQYFPEHTGTDSAWGYVKEIVQVSDDGQKSAVLWAQFETTCNGCTFAKGNVIQNWLQMEGTAPGRFTGFTCNAGYQPDRDYLPNPSIINKTNWVSFDEVVTHWEDRQGTTDGQNGKWWNAITKGAEEVYKTTYKKNKLSTQGCGAWAPIYQVDADGNYNGSDAAVLGTRGDGASMDEMYWKMKNAGSVQMWSGFKLWTDDGQRLYQSSPTVTMDYQFQDLGFVDPNPVVDDATDDTTGDDAEPAEEMEMTESGASALFTAAATAFAAALLF